MRLALPEGIFVFFKSTLFVLVFQAERGDKGDEGTPVSLISDSLLIPFFLLFFCFSNVMDL